MRSDLNRLITLPVFENQDKNRVARLLNHVLWLSILVSVLLSGGLWLIHARSSLIWIMTDVFLTFCVGLLWLMRQGRVNLSAIFISYGIWVFVSMNSLKLID